MRLNIKKTSAFATVLLATILSGAKMNQTCEPKNPAPCYPEPCRQNSCYGPTNKLANTPVKPLTCNGDWIVGASILLWKSQENGLEYSIRNNLENTNPEQNNLIDSKILSPKHSLDIGYQLGLGYNTTCDGWDIQILWTHFFQKTADTVCTHPDENTTLLPIWSAYQPQDARANPILFATEIQTLWQLNLNLVDLSLGRAFWTGKRLALHPHIGLRYGRLNQAYNIDHRGGSFQNNQPPIHDQVHIDCDYKGVGILTGLDSNWHLGCGWGLYGNLATSLLYGRFQLDHRENARLSQTPFSKTRILETKEHLRASRSIVDLALGLQWTGLFCQCQYAVTIALGFEKHLFFHQNQMWRTVRLQEENTYNQTQATLSTSGWTVRGNFEF